MACEDDIDLNELLRIENTLKIEEERNNRDLVKLYSLYYQRLFPSSQIYRWLSYGDASTFAKREIAFELGDQTYIRYQSYDSLEEFLSDFVTDIVEKITRSIENRPQTCPIKIDIGAMYYPNPNEVTFGLKAFQKEVVFDIDMSDYDDVRTCCIGARVCNKCWKFLAIASKIIDTSLKEDFGFQHILWVFSGRRGIHAWLCDESSQLGIQTRYTLVLYLQIITGGKHTLINDKVKLPENIHFAVRRAISIIDTYFMDLVKEQDFLGTDERLTIFLKLIDNSLKPAFYESMSQAIGSLERWAAFEETLSNLNETGNLLAKFKHLKEQIKLYFAYPRLDIQVTKNLGHLLKAPFCVHPKTEKVSIPFDVFSVDDFDPNAVPTIDSVVEEIHAYERTLMDVTTVPINKKRRTEESVVPEMKDIEHTSLLGPVNLFIEFIRNMENARKPP